MNLNFVIIERGQHKPTPAFNTVYLRIDYWNDFSFVTMFYLTVFDQTGTEHDIGNIKIAFKGQTEQTSTHSTLGRNFSSLTEEYFSLGVDLDFYENLGRLDETIKDNILSSLQDIVFLPERLPEIENERVLNTSLLRGVSLSDIHGQFARVLKGLVALSDFHFNFIRNGVKELCNLRINFTVKVDSIPSTNIHALIGRNGCGKTTILNGMIEAITDPTNNTLYFTEKKVYLLSLKYQVDILDLLFLYPLVLLTLLHHLKNSLTPLREPDIFI